MKGPTTAPRLAGHTLTLVNSSILLIGGFSPYNTFNTRVYVYDLHKAAWVEMDTNGSKPTGRRRRKVNASSVLDSPGNLVILVAIGE